MLLNRVMKYEKDKQLLGKPLHIFFLATELHETIDKGNQ